MKRSAFVALLLVLPTMSVATAAPSMADAIGHTVETPVVGLATSALVLNFDYALPADRQASPGSGGPVESLDPLVCKMQASAGPLNHATGNLEYSSDVECNFVQVELIASATLLKNGSAVGPALQGYCKTGLTVCTALHLFNTANCGEDCYSSTFINDSYFQLSLQPGYTLNGTPEECFRLSPTAYGCDLQSVPYSPQAPVLRTP